MTTLDPASFWFNHPRPKVVGIIHMQMHSLRAGDLSGAKIIANLRNIW